MPPNGCPEHAGRSWKTSRSGRGEDCCSPGGVFSVTPAGSAQEDQQQHMLNDTPHLLLFFASSFSFYTLLTLRDNVRATEPVMNEFFLQT